MQRDDFFIRKDDFKVWLPELETFEKSGDEAYNSRQIRGIMSTSAEDRQGERVLAKGLDLDHFLKGGHFNDNHDQATGAVVGYPEQATYSREVQTIKGDTREGWVCAGYLLKGTKRSDEIWDLAKALMKTPNRRLGFSIEGKVTRRNNNVIEKAQIRNVAVTNCFPGDTKVVGAANKVTRRFYSGKMVEIQLSTGEKITATPNHPILTNRGWIAISEIDEVNDRVGCFDSDLALSASISKVSHNVEDVPSTFEEIFNAASVSGDCLRIGQTGKRDFHGDGTTGDVDVVISNGFLRDSLYATFLNKFGKKSLTAADKKLSFFFSPRFCFKFASACLDAASSVIRGFGKQLALADGPSGVFNSVFFLNRSSDSVSFRDIVDGVARDAIFGGDRGRRMSKAVGFSNVSFKKTVDFSGHVYNLDTVHGWYETNGIIAHNCPVNTDATWDVLAKSFSNQDIAMKALSAGYGGAFGPSGQSGGAALGRESLDDDERAKKKKKEKAEQGLKILMRSYGLDHDEIIKSFEYVHELRPNFTDEAAAEFVKYLLSKGVRNVRA